MKMKLLKILAIIFCIMALALGSSDSDSMEWFERSKYIAASCFVVAFFLLVIIKYKS